MCVNFLLVLFMVAKIQRTQRWIGKWNTGCPHNGILFAREYEFTGIWSTRAWYQWTCGTIYQAREVSTKGHDVLFHLYGMPRTGKSKKAAGSLEAVRSWMGRGTGGKSQVFGGCDLKVLELGSAYNYVAVNTLRPLNCAHPMDELMECEFHLIKLWFFFFRRGQGKNSEGNYHANLMIWTRSPKPTRKDNEVVWSDPSTPAGRWRWRQPPRSLRAKVDSVQKRETLPQQGESQLPEVSSDLHTRTDTPE